MPAPNPLMAQILARLQGGASVDPALLARAAQTLGLHGGSRQDFGYQDPGQQGNWFTRANPNGTYDQFNAAAQNMQLQDLLSHGGGGMGNALMQRLAQALGVGGPPGAGGGPPGASSPPPGGGGPPQGSPNGSSQGVMPPEAFWGQTSNEGPISSGGPANHAGMTEQAMNGGGPLQAPSGGPAASNGMPLGAMGKGNAGAAWRNPANIQLGGHTVADLRANPALVGRLNPRQQTRWNQYNQRTGWNGGAGAGGGTTPGNSGGSRGRGAVEGGPATGEEMTIGGGAGGAAQGGGIQTRPGGMSGDGADFGGGAPQQGQQGRGPGKPARPIRKGMGRNYGYG
jgi:hypothetical protein